MSEAAEPTREELRAVLMRRTGPLQALVAGARLAGRSAGVGLPFALVFALISAGVGQLVIDFSSSLATMEAPTAELGMQVCGGLAGFLALFGAIQFSKRHTATRASWWPVLLLVPVALLGVAFAVAYSGQARQLGPVVAAVPFQAWYLFWSSFGGAMTAIAWVRAGDAAEKGTTTSLGEVLGEVQRRVIEVAGPHGARVQAVAIGMQVLVPGIFYMLQLAFTDMVAVLEPERPALRRSGQLTWGMRGRLFRMMLVWFVVLQALVLGVTLGIDGLGEEGMAGRLTQFIMDPAGFSFAALLAQEIVWVLGYWLLTMALLVLYFEREAQVKAKTALKRLDAEQAGA